jgi:hypothetical protein
MRTVVYLIDQPLDERNYHRFGIRKWLDRGWQVEVWDLTPWVFPQAWQYRLDHGLQLMQFAGYFPIASRAALRGRDQALGDVGHCIGLTGETRHSRRARLMLVRRGAVRTICMLGTQPIPASSRGSSVISRLRRIIAKPPLDALAALGNALERRLLAPLVAPGLIVVSGDRSIPAGQPARKIVRSHNFDYDIYLELRRSAAVAAPAYAVFIDQDYCFHPDFVSLGIAAPVTADKYFGVLCNGLRTLSRALRLSVQIAAHPRSTYQSRGSDYFQGLPISYGRTAELIRDSAVVVCHSSTAVQFAVLFSKPIIFVTTDELVASPQGRYVSMLAAELGKSPINLDADLSQVDWDREMRIDAAKYSQYQTRYIKSAGSPELPLWDIVIDHIEKSTAGAVGLATS